MRDGRQAFDKMLAAQ